ncbi:MAG: hypothetical protein D6693_07350 [Planctomycetota bacterium]|nr:MAG: hypothetical protein D6693_07350 [Planctomycetota bacterium]
MLAGSDAVGAPPVFGTASNRIEFRPESLCVADLNGDTLVDALVTSSTDGAPGIPDPDAAVLHFGRGDGTFDRGPTIPNAGGFAALGDVTGDGLADLVTARHGRLRVHRGDGAGGFAAPAEIFTADLIFRPQLADLDGAGPLEIVLGVIGSLGDPNPTGVYVLGADGQGGFVERQRLTGVQVFSSPDATREPVATGDLNGDGFIDAAVIVGDSQGQSVVALINDGIGALAAKPAVALPAVGDSVPWIAITAGDATGDGVDDAAVATNNGAAFAVLPGGLAGLGPAQVTADPAVSDPSFFVHGAGSLTAIRITDSDGDADNEIIVLEQLPSSDAPGAELIVRPGGAVSVYKRDAAGDFGRVESPYAGARPLDVAFADCDGDGRRDALALSDFDETSSIFNQNRSGLPGSLSFLRRAPNGRLRSPRALTPFSFISGSPRAVAIADADTDGDLDVLFLHDRVSAPVLFGSAAVSAVLNDNGVSIFPLPDAAPFITLEPVTMSQRVLDIRPIETATLRTTRLGMNGAPAFIVGGPAFDFIGAFLGDLPVGVELGGAAAQAASSGPVLDVALADVAGGPEAENIILLGSVGGAQLYLRVFGDGLDVLTEIERGSVPIFRGRLSTADVDRDGRADAIVTLGDRPAVLRSLGDGTFQQQATLPAAGAGIIAALDCADVNHDGAPDLIVGGFLPFSVGSPPPTIPSIAVYMNDGAGGFGAPIPVAAVGGILDIKAVDIDRDGAVDLVAGVTTGYVEFLRGDGLGGFGAGELIDLGGGRVHRLEVGDVTNDGRPDVVAISGTIFWTVFSQMCCNAVNALYLIESTDRAARFGDVNRDDAIGAGDISAVLSAWGPCPAGPCPADLTGDGAVDGADLTVVLSNFGL